MILLIKIYLLVVAIIFFPITIGVLIFGDESIDELGEFT